MTRHNILVCVAMLLLDPVSSLIPATPAEQTLRAIRSLRNAIEEETNKPKRLYVDYLIPLPPETVAADIDPWPGGLAQMYPYAEDILKEIIGGIVDDAGTCSSQVISPQDCCGFFVQESNTSPRNDIAALLFPGVDQLDKIAEIDQMVGDRTLVLFNRQFKRSADFGFGNKEKSDKIVFDKFSWGFAFQEFACRGEDVKLTFEYPNWQSCAICDEDQELGAREIPLLDPKTSRPLYDDLETKINEVLPEPLWMRKMGEVETKGFKFQRGQND
mmetsp:Transcript_19278/g.26734  ORF Transcript_19278/g.26734 Transcript_19278/m.26734 type:complete len:272 (+) Transcript_19278:13-828(+)